MINICPYRRNNSLLLKFQIVEWTVQRTDLSYHLHRLLNYEFNISELSSMTQPVLPGINSFLSEAVLYKNKRLALVTNDAAKTTDGILSRVALLKNDFNLVKIFSPEHGITVAGADGAFQNNNTDRFTGLPVISLYGNHIFPTGQDLSDIDIVLFDIPDVGCRFYTYLWTMTYVMESCALYGKQLIILDRPNPIGGNMAMAEGPMLDEINCSSFIGRWSIPVRHSCSLGELALFFSSTKINNPDLKIVRVKNWQRNQMAGTAGFDFIPTSPAIQNISTALLYPGTGLLEGINVNEGRGTDKPFSIFGAPWINADKLMKAFQSKNLPGISVKTCTYTPTDSLYKEEKCSGLELFITEPLKLRPVKTGIEILRTLIHLFPAEIKQRLYSTRANPSGLGHLDKLLGVENVFEKIKNNTPLLTEVAAEWTGNINSFLLYK